MTVFVIVYAVLFIYQAAVSAPTVPNYTPVTSLCTVPDTP